MSGCEANEVRLNKALPVVVAIDLTHDRDESLLIIQREQ